LGDDYVHDECDVNKDFWNVCCENEEKIPPPLDIKNSPTKCGKHNFAGYGISLLKVEEGLAEYAEFPWMLAIMKSKFFAET
jgi:hypothetical protein